MLIKSHSAKLILPLHRRKSRHWPCSKRQWLSNHHPKSMRRSTKARLSSPCSLPSTKPSQSKSHSCRRSTILKPSHITKSCHTWPRLASSWPLKTVTNIWFSRRQQSSKPACSATTIACSQTPQNLTKWSRWLNNLCRHSIWIRTKGCSSMNTVSLRIS